MIKQLASKEVEDYIKNNPKSVLLDVRTKEEWSEGKPDGDNEALHRLDRALAIEILTGAGFVLEDDNDLLANPEDDHTNSVFAEGLRGNTDRFVLKFRKPAT